MIATVSKKSREQIVPYARRKLILLVNGTTHFFCFVGTMDDDWRFVMIHLLLSIVWMCALLRIRWVGSDFFVPILAETNVRMLELISILWIMMIFIYLFSKFFNIKRDQVQSSIKNCNRIFSAKSTSRRHSSSSWNHIVYDDIFFRFYYRFTCIILLILSIIIIIREWSVDSIDCNVPASVIIDLTGSGGELSYYRLNAYCRMHNRFIRYTEQNSWCTNTTFMANQEAIIPKYQWFALILFCSCILLYVPHLLWKCTNRSMIKSVIFNRFQRLRLSYLFRLDQLIKICLQSPTSIVLINNQTFFDDRSHLHHSPKQHGTNSVGWNLEVIDEEVDDSNEYECIEMNSRRIT